MVRINGGFPQPVSGWNAQKPSVNGDVNKRPPKTSDINEFMQTEDGEALLEIFNTRRANQPKPDANAKRL